MKPDRRTSANTTRSALAALATLVLGACKPAPRCPELDDCDVRAAACQASAFAQAACLRGRGEPAAPPVSVKVREADAYLDALAAAAPADEATRTMRRGLALLGLVATDDDPETSVRTPGRLTAAYYDASADEVVIVRSPGQRLDDGRAVLLLVHELVHVLQARAGELTDTPPRFDAALASAAVREGEAQLLTDEAFVAGVGLDFDDIGYDDTLYFYGASQFAYTRLAHSPLDELPLRFPYAEGARYLRTLRTAGGRYDSARAFRDPPASTRDVLARDPFDPARYPNDLGDGAVPELPELSLVGTVHLGAYAHAVVSQRYRSPWFGWALPPASAFRADTLAVFSDADGGVVASWRIRYGDSRTAEAAADAIADLLTIEGAREQHVRVGVLDGELWLVLAESAELLAGIPEAPSFAPAPEADFDLAPGALESPRCMAGTE